MKKIQSLLALALCLCLLPFGAFAADLSRGAATYTVEAGGTHAANTYTPARSGLYAVAVQKDGETLDPLPAMPESTAVYAPGLSVSVTAQGTAAQAVDYNVFYLTAGRTYSVQVVDHTNGAYDASGEWTVSVQRVDAAQLAPDAATEGEWFTFTPDATGGYALSATGADGNTTIAALVEVYTPQTVKNNDAWQDYVTNKEAYLVACAQADEANDALAALQQAHETAHTELQAQEAELKAAEKTLEGEKSAYEKALNKIEYYDSLLKLGEDRGLFDDSKNDTWRQSMYTLFLKPAARNYGVEIPDDYKDFPAFAHEQIEENETLAASYEEQQEKVDAMRADYEAAEAAYDAETAALAEATAAVAQRYADLAAMRADLQSEADALVKAGTGAESGVSGLALQSAKWLYSAADSLSVPLTEGTTYTVHVLTDSAVSVTVRSTGELPPVSVDRAALEQAIAAAEKIDRNQYTDASLAALDAALQSAKTVLADSAATQTDVDNAAKALNDAIAALKEKPVTPTVDKTALEQAIAAAEKIDRNKYTDASLAALDKALQAAKSVRADSAATQTDADNAAKALNDAVAALKEKPVTPTVDKTALEQAIAAAEKVDRDQYTDASLAALDKALQAAKSVRADSAATQTDADNAAKALNNAIAALREKPASGVDTSALETVIAKAEAISREDYTEDSLATLDRALRNANTVLADASATQIRVNNAERVLNNALDGLEKKSAPSAPQFVDVPANAYYAEAVDWAVANGVTTGMDETHFAPNADCTRAQIVTFLWRANGSPKVEGTNPFRDVPSSAYYYDAVLWAVQKGITTGTSATTFSPNDTCTRAQAVTFLWRMEDEPTPSVSRAGFVDVSRSAYYATAVLWAVGENITNGTDATHFSPNLTCSRGQIVTFLYRDRG